MGCREDVPGWHEATKDAQQEGKVKMIGIIEEQHPDRARLFMQWKQMNWPILVDSLNLLGVEAVPITLAIDESGIIRAINPEKQTIGRTFLDKNYEKPASAISTATKPDLLRLKAATDSGTAESWRIYADGLALWGTTHQLGEAIDAYQRALEKEPAHGPTAFRLGTTFRKRYDSGERRRDDFGKAVEYWEMALSLNPNQYIWRRRLQQYGPRLEKPYSFFDWVITARKEIQSRGQTPVQLTVEPGGAEFAQPSKQFERTSVTRSSPDPSGRILRDKERFIEIETTMVPPTVAPGNTVRVHVLLRPDGQSKAHWNNEAQELVFWIDPPPDWEVTDRYLTFPNPREPLSVETREIEFEMKCPNSFTQGIASVPAYALYYACEGLNGTCFYRRQDARIQLQVKR